MRWLLVLCSLAALAAEAPRIHGPKVYGARPGRPFLYTIPVTGERPMAFSADGLPAGLQLDGASGRISGRLERRGEFRVTLRARNARGADMRELRIIAGDAIALTPPMGYSTWYMAYEHISDRLVRAQADAMVASGLIEHGYSYINLDDGWNVKAGSGEAARDAEGNLRPNRQFPDMKALCDYVHSKGLKIGIYISPGPRTCAGYEGSYGHEEQDARQFARWGFDFLKYDWCSYDKIAKDKSRAELQKPYRVMAAALGRLDRDLVYNLCQYGMGDVWEWGKEVGGNYWRTTGDLGIAEQGLWASMSTIGFSQAGKEKWAGPGGWNDPDNILLGHILWKDKLQPAPFTRDEQYTYMTLWSMLAAPLIFGGDLTQLDEFTLGLLTNDEVIDVNQDALGRQAAPAARAGSVEVWARELEDGSKAVALFNRGAEAAEVTARWADLGMKGRAKVRDLWRHQDLGAFEREFSARVAPHGAVMVKVSK